MGLSGRRRAKKVTTGGHSTVTADDGATLASESRQQLHRTHLRSGNTQRRLYPAAARDRKDTNLLAFQLSRGWSNDLLPAKQATNSEIGAAPNANLYSRDMLRLLDADYHSHVAYSLNKQQRWKFPAELARNYQNSGELQAQNLFLFESVARGPASGGATRRATTNASYITDAAAELREHKRKLQSTFAYQPKQLAKDNDRFEFSERVKQKQADRPLSSVGSAASRGGNINARSIRRACNLWSRLYDVSPRAEEARLAMQRDYEGRMEIVVGTCVPCPRVDVNRCRQAEKENRQQATDFKPNKDKEKFNRKLANRMMRKSQRCDWDLQLGLDGEADELIDEFAEIDGTDQELECLDAQRTAAEVTLFDAMRSQDSAVESVNRAKKLAAKAQKMKKAMLQCRKKLRNVSDQTLCSSGYDSGSESHEEATSPPAAAAAAEAEASAANSRLAAAVSAALVHERPLVRVPREAADAARVAGMFADASAAGALVISKSLPRKLAVLLLPDLSETVVFEEAAAAATPEDPETVTYAVHHACSSDRAPRTSAQEVTSQADPFAFLRGLVAAPSAADPRWSALADGEKSSCLPACVGWYRAQVRSEVDARLTAVQALPMFSASAADADDYVELVSRSECEICCQELFDAQPDLNSGLSFARGSTMLIQCGHSFCNRCWLQHVATCVASGRTGITCPGSGCQSALDAATLLWFCPGELLPALSAAAFRAWLVDRRQGRQRRLCPRRNCGVLECPAGVNATCGVCSSSLCLGCGQEPHWPVDCATAARYRTKMDLLGHSKLELKDINAEVNVNAKQCPACQLIMEKGVGCNHMSCPCGEQFCWWCGQPLRAHTGGPCSGGDAGRSRSNFHVQRVFTAADSILVPNSALSRVYCEAVKLRLHRQRLRFGTAAQRAVADLLVSYAIRFRRECRGSWDAAQRFADRTVRHLLETGLQASFLAEYSFAHLDSHRWDRPVKAAVRVIGRHVGQLATDFMTEIDEQRRGGYRGPRLTKVGCERLLMLQGCLQSKCRMLSAILARHRDSPALLAA